MKKSFYLLAIAALYGSALTAQKALIINGGQFGNPKENVTLYIYDPLKDSSSFVDSIHSQSVQDVLVDSIFAYVAAQDSIIKYNLNTESRVAAAGFNGFSTKSMAVYKNYLLVGNWYGKTSSNLYIYDKHLLSLQDSIVGISRGVNSILIRDSIALLSQNELTSNYEDTLGYIARVNLNNLTQLASLLPKNYSGDIGQLIPNGNGFISINGKDNSFVKYSDLLDTAGSLHSFDFDLQVGSSSQFSINKDTLYLKFNGRIGAVDMQNFSLLDSSIVDTVITAFAYDKINQQFYVTQTDYFSYSRGGVYAKDGNRISSLTVGFSPEVIAMYYQNTSTGIPHFQEEVAMASMYPNPGREELNIELSKEFPNANLKIFNIQGQLMLEKKLKGIHTKLNIAQLKAGTYILLLESDYQLSTSRLIKL